MKIRVKFKYFTLIFVIKLFGIIQLYNIWLKYKGGEIMAFIKFIVVIAIWVKLTIIAWSVLNNYIEDRLYKKEDKEDE